MLGLESGSLNRRLFRTDFKFSGLVSISGGVFVVFSLLPSAAVMRRQNNEYRNRPNITRPLSPASADSKDGSVERSSDTGSGLMRDSRITSRWAQKTFNCVSPSEDLIGHGSLVSDVKNSVQPSSDTGSGLMPNSRITSRSAQKTFNCVSPSEDLIQRGSLVSDVNSSVQPSSHAGSGVKRNSRITSRSAQKTLNCVSTSEDLIGQGSLVSDVKILRSGIEGLNLSAYSPLESDESGKKYASPHLKKASPIASSNLNEIFHREGHQDEESSAKEPGLKSKVVSYDICPPRPGSVIVLKTPLHEKNKKIRNEKKRNMEGNTISILRPGMILLKSYLSFTDQVKLVSTCRNLGMKPGGFYQPGYRDGAELNLKMMCLGKRWDPEKGYVDILPTDVASPPLIPVEFSQLVERVLKDSHAHLKEKHKNKNVEDILPSMSPNICIVNFYTASGRLGLHQDKDESSQSLKKELPVVSFSVGDSAEFLYGDQRDALQAEKVVLDSGDVLIFGGKARHIYHGVSAINRDTAPKSLLEETNLRPGRLNLTFREY